MPSGPSQPRSSSQIIVCGQPIWVDWDRVYNFRDHPDFDASQLHCFLDAEQRPVSYTHLDVYKRQERHWVVVPHHAILRQTHSPSDLWGPPLRGPDLITQDR